MAAPRRRKAMRRTNSPSPAVASPGTDTREQLDRISVRAELVVQAGADDGELVVAATDRAVVREGNSPGSLRASCERRVGFTVCWRTIAARARLTCASLMSAPCKAGMGSRWPSSASNERSCAAEGVRRETLLAATHLLGWIQPASAP